MLACKRDEILERLKSHIIHPPHIRRRNNGNNAEPRLTTGPKEIPLVSQAFSTPILDVQPSLPTRSQPRVVYANSTPTLLEYLGCEHSIEH